MNTRPYAVFSCDLDTVDRHLQGYGIEDLAACDRIYRTAVPRLLELFAELGVPGVLLRLPVYHTLSYFVPSWLFARGLRSALRSDRPLCYEFHAADFLELASDGIDRRMDRHPGMKVSLTEKRESLRAILATIASERRVVTYRQAMEEGMAA